MMAVVLVTTQTEGEVTLEGAKAGKKALLSEWKERMSALLGEGAPAHKETTFVAAQEHDAGAGAVDKAVAAAMKKAAASKKAIVGGARLSKLTHSVANEKQTKLKTKKKAKAAFDAKIKSEH